MSILLVLCTCPDADGAQALAASLVEQRLAACVNVLPNVRSIYRWEGKLDHAQELLLLIKTTADRFDDLKEHIVSMHPYAVPEILGLDVVAGLAPYLDWVAAETSRPGTTA
ncbi:MAG TPA: divalent-cation tolerance protein CutA [Xanthomonadaceae bacterium]|jgi:periplasmic divalent cation tolerance protein|nr:divalent-cation tolerance protein CutA [Xanthomonadaceae bacterium]